MMDDLVSTAWLADNLSAADVAILDASLFLPGTGRDAHAEYRTAHIPRARFLDLDALVDRDHPAPHMLPPSAEFGAAMAALGVGRDDRIIVYDNSPLRSATRGWFMLRHFGATSVAILDGGLAKWIADGHPVEAGEAAGRTARFDASASAGTVVTKRDIRSGVGVALLDARGAARFAGTEPEPRPGVTPGHIPGSRNLPFSTLYRDDGTFKRGDELRRAFDASGVDPDHSFVATCGSGVTATSLIFAARLLGNRDARLYDGSWGEYGADPDAPKATGAA